jgi:hypothetical protein
MDRTGLGTLAYASNCLTGTVTCMRLAGFLNQQKPPAGAARAAGGLLGLKITPCFLGRKMMGTGDQGPHHLPVGKGPSKKK